MQASTIILAILSSLGTISSIVFAYLAFRRNEKKDDKDEVTLLSDIIYNKQNTIKNEESISKLEEKYCDLLTRIATIEQKIKSTNLRIEELCKEQRGD